MLVECDSCIIIFSLFAEIYHFTFLLRGLLQAWIIHVSITCTHRDHTHTFTQVHLTVTLMMANRADCHRNKISTYATTPHELKETAHRVRSIHYGGQVWFLLDPRYAVSIAERSSCPMSAKTTSPKLKLRLTHLPAIKVNRKIWSWESSPSIYMQLPIAIDARNILVD